jgi:hypothetical protein
MAVVTMIASLNTELICVGLLGVVALLVLVVECAALRACGRCGDEQ